MLRLRKGTIVKFGGLIDLGLGITLEETSDGLPQLVTAEGQYDNGTKTADFTINWQNGKVQRVTLGNKGSAFTVTLNNGKAGDTYTLEVVQDGTGSRTISAWNAESGASVLWPSGTPPTLTTTANRADVITFKRDDVPATKRYLGQTYGLNYAV